MTLPFRTGLLFAHALAEGMRRYNERLLRVCRERGAECLDLATRVARSAEFFWDDMHFTEAGSRRVAELVAGYLLEREPLVARRSERGGSAARSSARAGMP